VGGLVFGGGGGGFCLHRHATFGVFYKTDDVALCVSMP